MNRFNNLLMHLLPLLVLLVANNLFAQISFGLQSSYKYLKGTNAVGLSSTWIDPGFDDSGWSSGTAPFRYGDGVGGTELTDMNGNYSTVFLRAKFSVSQAELLQTIQILANWDDGFIIWINGYEVLKQQAPANVSYNALASDLHESGTPESFTFNADQLHLINGENTIAVLACNISLEGSSDFYFDISISAQAEQPDQPELVDSIGLTFSHPSGFYTSVFNLDITSPVADAEVIYTLDGSNPQTSATAVKAGVKANLSVNPASTVKRGTTPAVVVRASITKEGYKPSKPEARTFIYIEKVKTQSYPGWDWPSSNVQGQFDNPQEIDLEMDYDVVNSAQYKNLIDDALLDIPSVSIVTDNANLFDPINGIYVNALAQGEEWERECSIELINPDGSAGFNINAGLRIRGGWSRHSNYPKHAFRLFFRTMYGASKLYFPLFGDEGVDHFDKVDLRCAQNYSWANSEGEHNTFVREVFLRDAQGESGNAYTRTRYYHLYLNGMYWGLFETQERSEARWASDYMGGKTEDWDVIKRGGVDDGSVVATDGNIDKWRQVWNIINTATIDNTRYFELQGKNANGLPIKNSEILVDIDNLIDYMINIFYSGNFDSPVSAWGGNTNPNNIFMVKNREDKTLGFKFLVHDAEHTLMAVGTSGPGTVGLYENRVNLAYRSDARMNDPGLDRFHPQWLHHKLTSNAEYRQRFADRAWRQLTGNGIFTEDANIQRLNKRAEQIDLAIIAESARWGDAHRWDGDAYTKDNAWLPELNVLRNEYFPYRTGIVIDQLLEYDLFPSVTAPIIKESGIELVDPKVRINASKTVTITSSAGEIYYTLNGKDPRKLGGGVSSDAIKINSGSSISIPQSAVLKTRVLNDNKWSALNAIDFIMEQTDYSNLKVTELHYHPLQNIEGTDTTSGDSYEFIEFKNIGTESAINLSGLVIDSAIYYEFPDDYLLAPQQFFVAAAKPKKFYDRHGMLSTGNFKKNFLNSGEQVLITNSKGQTVMNFWYFDTFPWPETPDGDGPSLVAAADNPTGDPTDPIYWKASRNIDGSPFYDDSYIIGVDETAGDLSLSSLRVYPNPTNDLFNVQFDQAGFESYSIKIYDLNGAVLYASKFVGDKQISLSHFGLSYGVYFVKIEGQSGSKTEKLIYTP